MHAMIPIQLGDNFEIVSGDAGMYRYQNIVMKSSGTSIKEVDALTQQIVRFIMQNGEIFEMC